MMEKDNLPLYVHGMGRRRLGPLKEKLTEEKKKELIEEYMCPCNPLHYEDDKQKNKGSIIDFQI